MRKSFIVLALLLCISLVSCSKLNYQLKRYAKRAHHNPKTHEIPPFVTNPNPNNYETGWFNQTLDHFNYNSGINSETWSQRYLYNDTYWGGAQSLSPILFYTGNESPINVYWQNDRFIIDVLAPQLSAYILFAEHRYFGESLPFGNDSFNEGNLNYCTTEQAMGDYVDFLIYYKTEVLNCYDCPVIAFGGSYGGMLTAWMRMKFPNIIDGGIAASAPIRMFDWVTDTELSYEILSWDFGNSTTPGCASVSKEGFSRLYNYSQINGNQYETVNQAFNLCPPIKNNEEIANVIGWISGAYFTIGELNYPYPMDYVTSMPASPVNYSCQAFTGLTPSSSDIEIFTAMGRASNIFYDYYNTTNCTNIYNSEEGSIGILGWDILACGPMAIEMQNNGIQDIFPPGPFNATAYTQGCNAEFGIEPRYLWALEFFGGFNLEEYDSYSNIFFSNGNFDPWTGGGVLTNISDSLVAYFIIGGAHHIDLYGPSPVDPPGVTIAREMETNYIQQWIQEKQNRVRKQRAQQEESFIYNSLQEFV